MAGLDTNVFDKIQTVDDYNKANTDFLLKKQQAQQALQTGNIAQANQANVYATQLISGATATGDQNQYNSVLNTLKSNGIDTSAWAPDVATAQKQAQAARLAQSPLGSLLNAGLKVDSNNIAMGGLTGQVPQLNGVAGLVGGVLPGAPSPQTAQPAPQASVSMGTPPAPQAAPQPEAQPALPASLPQSNSKFIPPQRDPNQTLAAYQQQYQQALEAYKTDPSVLTNQAAAADQGKVNVANQEAANKADELTKRLTQNLNGMLQLNDTVPQSGFIPASTKAYMSRAMQANGLGDGEAAKSYAQWDQINNQQVLSEIQQFVASGGANTRVNQTLEKIAKAASSISPDEAPATRAAEIKNALAELQNKNISGQNLVNDNKGQPTSNYGALPVTTPQPVNLNGASDQPQTKSEKAASLIDNKISSIPGPAAAALKSVIQQNPAVEAQMRAQFDAKYGVGTSSYVLGQ